MLCDNKAGEHWKITLDFTRHSGEHVVYSSEDILQVARYPSVAKKQIIILHGHDG